MYFTLSLSQPKVPIQKHLVPFKKHIKTQLVFTAGEGYGLRSWDNGEMSSNSNDRYEW